MTAAEHRAMIDELLRYNNGRYKLQLVKFDRTSYNKFLERENLNDTTEHRAFWVGHKDEN